jgi:acyl-CoA synthetase (NDP forming)
MAASRTGLARLFSPASVAVVGASTSQDKAGYQAVLALRDFPGEVFPINPKGGEVAGLKAWPSLKALGRSVDLVLFAIPAALCVDAVREAIASGCGAGLILGGGFAEAGPSGAKLQAELEQSCRGHDFRLLGPNTAGFVNTELPLTASFLPSASRIPAGEVGVVAQSAGISLTLSFLLARLGFGVSCGVGLGNAVDVDAPAVIEFLAEHPRTKVIAVYLEGVNHGRRLYETLRRVTPKKPVVAMTVGKRDIGEFAQSHTGNLLGSYAVRVNALRQAGAVVVDSTEELAAAAAVLSLYRLSPKEQAGVGIITAQAGAGLVMLDWLRSRGVSVPALTAPTLARIRACLPPMTYLSNPVDTGRPGESFGDVFAALTDDPGIDAVIAYALSEPAALRPAELLPDLARRTSKPILFGTAGTREETEPTRDALHQARLYVAGSPDELARAAVTLVTDARHRARLARTENVVEPRASALTLPSAPDEDAAKALLESISVPTPRRIACVSHAAAHTALAALAKPVVVKILSAEISHKTEVGGVQLNIADDAGLAAALARLDAIPLDGPRRYLVEETAPAGLELIVGAVRDASFGPTVMVGFGGTLAEAVRDTATRLAPLALEDALEMLEELGAAALFRGWRGGPALDRTAVAQVIVDVGGLLYRYPAIEQFEINPLRVYPHGTLALDALMVLTPSPTALD